MTPSPALPRLFRHAGAVAFVAGCFCASASGQFNNQWVGFTNESATRLSIPSNTISNSNHEIDFGWGDLDKDGWTDLVVVRKQPLTTSGKRTNILLMNENGVLTDRTAQYATAADVPGDQGFLTPTNDRDVVMSDVDVDGWLDFVTAPVIGFGDPKHINHPRVYRNLGGGPWLGLRFEDARIPQLVAQVPTGANSCGIAAGDVTQDGTPELFLVDYDSGGGFGPNDLGHRLLVNDGNGFFADQSFARMTLIMMDSNFGTGGEIVDLNGDGLNEIVNSENGPINVRYNNPANVGHFNIFQTAYASAAYHMGTGDLNNDGRLDLIAPDDSQDAYLYNRGNDALGRVLWSPVKVFQFLAGFDDGFGNNSNVNDLDLDGWMDVVIADVDVDLGGCDRRSHIYHNPGGGSGSEPTLREERESSGGTAWLGAIGFHDADLRGTHDVATFDIDNDGAEDMVFGRCTGTFVWMNDTVCQQDLGEQGEGPARMTVCGDALSTGNVARMVVSPVPTGATALLLGSTTSTPTHAWEVQSVLVPIPPLFVVAVVTDPILNVMSIPIAGGGGPGSLYVQWIIEDPDAGTPTGYYATNAVRMDFLP